MIYFIKAGNCVKIGYSKNPTARLKELQTGNSKKLKLLCTIPGDFKTEAALHEVYKANKQQGEWFSYTGKLKNSIIWYTQNKTYTTLKEFILGGYELSTRQAANRKVQRGDPSLKTRIASIR